MTQESKNLIKKYWQAGAMVVITLFVTQFLANFSSQKLWEYRIQELEIKLDAHIKNFDEEYKPNIDILSWMHNIGIRNGKNAAHEHKTN